MAFYGLQRRRAKGPFLREKGSPGEIAVPRDIHRMVEAMDSPDWIGVAPTGEKTSREQAERQLAGLLSVPAGQRPIPLQKIIYVSDSGSHALVVYWVYRATKEGPVGSMIRDTWLQTQVAQFR